MLTQPVGVALDRDGVVWQPVKECRGRDRIAAPYLSSRTNPEADFRGKTRTNDTHGSQTDPDAKLYLHRSQKVAAIPCYLGYVLTENRHGLMVDAHLTKAAATAER